MVSVRKAALPTSISPMIVEYFFPHQYISPCKSKSFMSIFLIWRTDTFCLPTQWDCCPTLTCSALIGKLTLQHWN